jgi:hypothetical protein
MGFGRRLEQTGYSASSVAQPKLLLVKLTIETPMPLQTSRSNSLPPFQKCDETLRRRDDLGR